MDLPITMLMTEALMPLLSQWTGVGGAAALVGGQNSATNRINLRPLELLFVSSPKAIAQAKGAMEKHESQMVWFRKLYVLFSRYMSVNELRRVM